MLDKIISADIAVCKCRPKTPGGAGTAGGEGQEYEEVDGGKRSAAVSDPDYMEVDEGIDIKQ